MNQAENKIVKLTNDIEGYSFLIEGYKAIKTAYELLTQLYDITGTYLETSIELAQQPMSIVKCAKVVEEVEISMRNAVTQFSSSIEASRETCKSTVRLLRDYRDLFETCDSTTREAQKAVFITMIDTISNAIDAGQGKLQKCSKEMKKVTGKLSTLKVYLHGPVGATILESVAAGVAEKKVVPGIMQKFGELKSLFQKLKTTLTKTNVELTSCAVAE